MPDSYFAFMLRRVTIAVVILIGFCLLPGPRSLIAGALGYIFEPESVQAIWVGFHLSVIHFCWLFGFEIQWLPYPPGTDALLAGVSFLLSVFVQVVVVLGLYIGGRILFVYYDDEGEDEDPEADEIDSAIATQIDLSPAEPEDRGADGNSKTNQPKVVRRA